MATVEPALQLHHPALTKDDQSAVDSTSNMHREYRRYPLAMRLNHIMPGLLYGSTRYLRVGALATRCTCVSLQIFNA